MKSIFGFLLALLVSGALSAQAQTAAPAATTPSTTMKNDGMASKGGKMKMGKIKAAPAGTMSGAAGPMKKDGTPDMRYKANKAKMKM